MPTRVNRACSVGGCAEPAAPGMFKCPAHFKAAWAARNERPEIAKDKRFYDSAVWRKFRRMVLAAEPWCRACRTALATVVDHVTRLRDGGDALSLGNVQCMCSRCHNIKRSEESKCTK